MSLETNGTDEAAATAVAGDGLGRTTARGAAVTLAGQLGQVILQMSSVIVLARLLTPKDYGLFATVLVVVGVGEIFRDFGLSSAAVQARELSHFQRDNLFWINSAIGVVLTAIALLIAPLVADLFDQPALTGITRVLAFTFFINGLATQYRASLNRDLKFTKLAASDLIAQAVGLSVGVTSAALGAGYWSLVAAQLAQVTSVLILVVFFGRWRPGRPRRGVPLRSLLIFGRNWVGTAIANYFGNNADVTVIALRSGAAPLGVYTRAFQLVMNPLNQFRAPATSVALPVLSRLHGDLPRANDYLRRGQLAIGYTVVALLAVGAGAAVPAVHLILGPQWHHAAPIFALLAVSGILQMLAYVGFWAYLSRGLTGDLFRYTLASFVLRAACILIGSQWGVVGVAWGYAVAHALEWPLSLWWLGRKTEYPTRQLYEGAGRILVVAAGAGLAAFGVSRGLASWPDAIVVLIAVVAGAAVYAVAGLVSPLIRADELGVLAVMRKVRSR